MRTVRCTHLTHYSVPIPAASSVFTPDIAVSNAGMVAAEFWVPTSKDGSTGTREVYRPLKMRDLGQRLKDQDVYVYWDAEGEEGWYQVEIQRVRLASRDFSLTSTRLGLISLCQARYDLAATNMPVIDC
jgi:hypothetical protein